MGRIRTALVKRNGDQLFKRYHREFKEDFTENKKLLEQFAQINSKKLRNVIAGYITKLVKQSKNDIILD